MRHLVTLLILIVLSGCSSGGGSSSDKGKLTVTITPDATMVLSGDDLTLTVATKNTTDKAITVRYECAHSLNGGPRTNFSSKTDTILPGGSTSFVYPPITNSAGGTLLIEFATIINGDTHNESFNITFAAPIMGAS